MSRSLRPPPFRCTLPPNAVQIRAQRPVLRTEPVWPPPYLRECLLHQIFRHLTVADGMTQEFLQPWRIVAIKRVESLCIALADALPNPLVVSQSASPPCYSGLPVERFTARQITFRIGNTRPHSNASPLPLAPANAILFVPFSEEIRRSHRERRPQ